MVVSAVPLLGMTVFPTTEAIGNEQQTVFPSLKSEDGSYNEKYLQSLGDYFSTHYAFRSEIISVDAEIQSKVFGISNLDSVVAGKNNWLYYSSTLDNYLGRNLMSSRALFNIVHNLELTQEYLNDNNVDFLFTVAPNKNTLYPENMPGYYSKKESEERNLEKLTSMISESSLKYCDLLNVLSQSEEVLYHKQDSHWNNKGALIAYNSILSSIEKSHDDYDGVDAVRKKNFYGDLSKMLYPSTAQCEFNYEYDIKQNYSYITPTKSVEEAIIITENSNAEGRLYMYRDSFGNALLPYFANAYNSAYFTKAFPVNLALEVQNQQSDTVIFEIVERNLNWFAESPPVIPAAKVSIPETKNAVDGISEVKAEVSQVNMQYISVTGCADKELCNDSSEFIVVITDNNNTEAFKAFTTSSDSSDYCFQAYIPAEYINSESVEVSLIIKNDDECFAAQSIKTEILQVEI